MDTESSKQDDIFNFQTDEMIIIPTVIDAYKSLFSILQRHLCDEKVRVNLFCTYFVVFQHPADVLIILCIEFQHSSDVS